MSSIDYVRRCKIPTLELESPIGSPFGRIPRSIRLVDEADEGCGMEVEAIVRFGLMVSS